MSSQMLHTNRPAAAIRAIPRASASRAGNSGPTHLTSAPDYRCILPAPSRRPFASVTTQYHTAAAAVTSAGPRAIAAPPTASAILEASVQPLAVYKLPLRHSPQRWLDETIRYAVLHVQEAPFLQATTSEYPSESRMQRFHVSRDVGNSPHLWRGIVQHLSGRRTNSVMYVSPLSPEAEHLATSCDIYGSCTAREVLSGVVAGSVQPLLKGQVGDCCHGPDHAADHGPHSPVPYDIDQEDRFAKASHIVPYAPLRPRQSEAYGSNAPEHSEGHHRGGSMAQGQLQEMYGVIIQSDGPDSLEGCFVLKTLRQDQHDCQCISYTLTKLCS